MKIGIMGGTFDPIHNGHLMLGEYAYREFKLDQVWFMPNGNPPHKQDNVFQTTREDRMEMVTRSIEKYDYFRLARIHCLCLNSGCIRSESLRPVRFWLHTEMIKIIVR